MTLNGFRRAVLWPALPILAAAFLAPSRTQGVPPDCAQCQSRTAGHADVSVDENEAVDKSCVRLSKQGGHKAKWHSKTGKPLIVTFTLKSGQAPPFVDMDCSGQVCSIRACDSYGVCESAKIHDGAAGCYAYRVKHRGGKGAGADPEVMIDP